MSKFISNLNESFDKVIEAAKAITEPLNQISCDIRKIEDGLNRIHFNVPFKHIIGTRDIRLEDLKPETVEFIQKYGATDIKCRSYLSWDKPPETKKDFRLIYGSEVIFFLINPRTKEKEEHIVENRERPLQHSKSQIRVFASQYFNEFIEAFGMYITQYRNALDSSVNTNTEIQDQDEDKDSYEQI